MSSVDYSSRAARAREAMAHQGFDLLAIGPGSNLFYFTGIHAMATERLYLMLLPVKGDPFVLLPDLEKLAASEHASYFDVRGWTDSEGYEDILHRSFPSGARTIAVDNYLASQFLLDVQQIAPQAKYMRGSEITGPLRIKKGEDEIRLMKQAAANADSALDTLKALRWSGRREVDIQQDVQRLLTEHGQSHMEFCIVGSGPNGAKPHHHTGDRTIQSGDVVVLDFGGPFEGYHSDMTRMLLVDGGTPDPEYFTVHEVVNSARSAAHAAARVGATCEEVDAAARRVISDAGYGDYFVHRTGHGIGIDLHEDPYIREGNAMRLDVGMAFSIEPGVYLPGRFGVRIEDIAIMTEGGSENINLSSHDVCFVA